MANVTVQEVENQANQLPATERLYLVERLIGGLRTSPPQDDWNAQLAAMAADPDIQRENDAINREFSAAETDGIEDSIQAAYDKIPAETLAEFEAAAKRPLAQRFRYAFIKTYKPVMDDAKFRSFETMAEYRQWCEENLPDWLGYGRI